MSKDEYSLNENAKLFCSLPSKAQTDFVCECIREMMIPLQMNNKLSCDNTKCQYINDGLCSIEHRNPEACLIRASIKANRKNE